MTDSISVGETLATAFARAITAHQAGRLDEAEAQYRIVLANDARHFGALHMLGLVHAQRGSLEAAERLIEQAIAIAPQDAAAHFNHGNVLLQRKKFAAAISSYDRVIAFDSRHSGAHCNRGLALHELGRFAEAVTNYDRAIALSPDNPIVHTNRGNALTQIDRFADALTSHDSAIALDEGSAEAWYNRGNVLMKLMRADASVESYDRAIALNSHFAGAWCNRGLALERSGRLADALASFDRAIAVDRRHLNAFLGRGNVLTKLKRLNESLESYDGALAHCRTSTEAWCNRGIACAGLGRFADAIANFEQAITLDPEDASVHRHLGIARLTTGDLERGWADYEWRWKSPGFQPRPLTQPCWSGDASLAGKTILLYAEQGLGDAIQFCRYAPLVGHRGATVILEVAPALTALMAALPGVSQVVTSGTPLPAFDMHCPLMSLPHAFKTTLDTVPAAVPYLAPSAASLSAWSARLSSLPSPRIGLTWAGNPQHANDVRRSIGLRTLLPLIHDFPASFVALQKDLGAGDAELFAQNRRITHLGDELATLEDTAAAICAFDLVISVDTSIAHLAGALGKPVWILLPFIPDWRWLQHRGDSPWYPTARLFRQSAPDDWTGVIECVGAELDRLLKTRDREPSSL